MGKTGRKGREKEKKAERKKNAQADARGGQLNAATSHVAIHSNRQRGGGERTQGASKTRCGEDQEEECGLLVLSIGGE